MTVINAVLLDGQRILSCSEDQFMKVIDVDTGLEIYSKDIGQRIK